jgi:cytochrome c-type biogenesis protein CcmH/NrfG
MLKTLKTQVLNIKLEDFKMTDKKIMGVIILVLAIALAVVSYIAFKTPQAPFDKEVYEKQIEELKQKNNTLMLDIARIESIKARRESEIDSLQSLKPKIIIRYETKKTAIERAPVVIIVNEFDSIFTSHNIR